MMPLIYSDRAQQELKRLLDRSSLNSERELAAVKQIIAEVRARGDEALLEYTRRFDCPDMTAQGLRVTQDEIESAYAQVDEKLLKAMRRSAANVRAFHEKQKQKTWLDVQKGRTLGQLIRPIASAGVYVPGGTAAYPSSVLMNVLPAKVAGVGRIVMVTPAGKDGSICPLTLVSAHEAGVDEIYKVGGAQAIAALAFGTESIPKVDKITGPGNIYVALAKREVFGFVGIDMIAGPSEVLVLADGSASPAYVAADLLSQAEHDALAAPILITDSEDLARAVAGELDKQLAALPRNEIATAALQNHGGLIVTPDMEEAVRLANDIAPEHLELLVQNPFELLGSIENAGAIFLGENAPEPLGDYFAGPNHVLPTSGTARFFSPLSVDDFIKKSSIISYSREALREVYEDIAIFAEAEGLSAHARSALIRFEGEE